MKKNSDTLRLAFLRQTNETQLAFDSMGVSLSKLRIAYCLNADRRSWSISALASATGTSRLTVRRNLSTMMEMGTVEKRPDGYVITAAGIKRGRERFDQFFELVLEPVLKFHRALASEYPGLGG